MINQKENMSENYQSEYSLGRLCGLAIGHSRTLPKIGSDQIYTLYKDMLVYENRTSKMKFFGVKNIFS